MEALRPFWRLPLCARGSTYLPGWLTQLNGVEIVTATDIGVGYNYPSTIQDGTQMIDLAPFIYTGGGISQTFATTPGTSYNVNFYGSSVSSLGRTAWIHSRNCGFKC